MDFQFDHYASYSDASTPRTPSPRTSVSSDDLHYPSPGFKPTVDVAVAPALFEHNDEHGIPPEPHAIKAAAYMHSQHYNNYPPPPGSRGSLLEELYEHDMPESNMSNDMYHHHHHQEPAYHPHQHPHSRHQGSWPLPQTAHQEHLPPMRHMHDIPMSRRATFPYGRHEVRDNMPYPPPPFMSESPSPYGSRPGTMYGDPLPMDMGHGMEDTFAHQVPLNASPHPPMYDMIKTEDSPVIVPSQTGYCRPPSAGMHGLPCLSPHAGLLVQHTDDAASKETQYLRRRCFNCHTTEPPSWRRSTLNPGKIVCNKCGLYERTHLRPRPLRFDELRAGSKTRKQPKAAAAGGSPKVGKLSPVVKKEARDSAEPLQRRSSVSSSNGSTPSANGASSDWDDSGELRRDFHACASLTMYSAQSRLPRRAPFPRRRSTPPQSRRSPCPGTLRRSRPRVTEAFACPTRPFRISLR